MVEAPALADAADGVDGAPENAERRQDKQQCRFVVWEVGQKVGSDHAGPDQQVSTGQRAVTEVEYVRYLVVHYSRKQKRPHSLLLTE